MTNDYQTIIFSILTDIGGAVSLFGAILLFLRGKNNRARRMLAWTMLVWGVCSIGRAAALQFGLAPIILQPLRLVGLIGGNIFIVLLMLFPIEVLLRGWLNPRRLLILFAPGIAVTLLYMAVMYVSGNAPAEYDTMSDFISDIGSFDAWFRLVLIAVVVVHNIFMLRFIYINEKKYVQWKNDNYSDSEYYDMSWMRAYAIAVMTIFVLWLLNVFVAQTWTFVVHSIITIINFTYFTYKGLFTESAYPGDFFRSKNDNPFDTSEIDKDSCDVGLSSIDESCDDDICFEERIPTYITVFKEWMDEEKPYLYRDFKLTDVARVIPLNRSYLSKVLNIGMGKNFCQVVRMYRVSSAKEMLENDPEKPIFLIAEECGFSSSTTFIRAFQSEMGVTPSRYRAEHSAQHGNADA